MHALAPFLVCQELETASLKARPVSSGSTMNRERARGGEGIIARPLTPR